MLKKRNFVLVLILSLALIIAIVFWVYNKESLSVGNIQAKIDNDNKVILVNLPEGSITKQKISFNFPFKNDDVYIKNISYGTKTIDNPIEKKLEDNSLYDFKDYIAHSKLIIKSGDSQLEYDLWVTTGNLPIMTIEASDCIPDEPKIDCNINIFSKTVSHTLRNIPGEIELVDYEEEIQKKSYSLNIDENLVTGSPPLILDFEQSSRFRLSACSNDNTFLREKLSYDLFEMFSDDNIAPKSDYVEIYLNNSYQGLYLLSRRVDRNMFSIENYNKRDKEHSVIYEASNWQADFSRGTKGFKQIEPDIENDVKYYEPLEMLINLINNSEEDNLFDVIEDKFNIDNIIDSHILFLFTASDNESAPFQYIYRDNKPDSKFYLCPGNHYSSSFGINENSVVIDTENSFFGNRLFNSIYSSNIYKNKLYKRWDGLRQSILKMDALSDLIDKNTLLISEAKTRDSEKWCKNTDLQENFSTGSEELVFLKNFIGNRIDWLDSYFTETPYFRIGDVNALINEEKKTIFCSLPQGSDKVQTISTNFGEDMYIEPLNAGSFSFSYYDFDKYREEIANFGENTNEININIDKFHNSEEEEGIIILEGWAVDFSDISSPGVKAIYIFDGPQRNKLTFLGKVDYGTYRYDVGEFYDNNNYDYSGFEHEIKSNFLKNGKHTLFLYALNENNDYTLKKVEIEVNNESDEIAEMNESYQIKRMSGEDYNFVEYIFHGLVHIDGRGVYDLWVTTGDVPIITINTNDQEIEKEHRVTCEVQIFSGKDLNSFNTSLIDAEIEIRGIASSSYPKKSYNLVLRDDNKGNEKKDLLDLYRSNKWSLNASYYDRSFMRNKLSFDILNEMFDKGQGNNIAPGIEYAEVFVNENYNGLYFLSEKVNRDLLGIEKYTKNDKDSSVIYKALNQNANYSLFTYDNKKKSNLLEGYELVYPDPDNLLDEDISIYWDSLEDYIKFISTATISEIENGVEEYLDIDNLIDFYLLIQLTGSYDGIFHNQFLYKDYGKDSKIKYTPWDYDETFGQQDQMRSVKSYDIHIMNPLFKKLLEIDFFETKVKERWQELRGSIINSDKIIKMIEKNDRLIYDAQKRNFIKYPVRRIEHYPQDYYTHEYDIEFMKEWIKKRIDWVDGYINNL